MATPGVSETAGYALQMYHTPADMMFNYGDAEEVAADIEVASLLLGFTAAFPEHHTADAARSVREHG